MNYYKHIDSLRGISILAILFYHLKFDFATGGFLGVDIFFTISGYLITSIIFNKINDNKFELLNFYIKRIRRILPVLLITLIIVSLISIKVLLPSELDEVNKSVISNLVFVPNIFFWKTTGYFAEQNELKPLLHTWSLGVEIQFYILFPIFIFFLKKKLKILKILIFILFFLSLFACYNFSNVFPSANFYLFPTRVWEILLGSIFYIVQPFLVKNDNLRINNSLSLVGIAMILGSLLFFNTHYQLPNLYSLIPTLGTGLTIIYTKEGTVGEKILSSKILGFLGLLSFSIYLFHYVIISFLSHLSINNLFFVYLVTFIISIFSYKFIETPFRNSLAITNKTLLYVIFFLVAFILIIISFSKIYKNFLFLYKEEDKNLISINRNAEVKYVSNRFNNLLTNEFDNTNKNKKILIIGDSFAQDLVNVLYESKMNDKFQIVTNYVSFNCGALFVEMEKLLESTPKDDHYSCRKNPSQYLFENKKINSLIEQADQIWISANWKTWQIKFLNKSINNIKNISDIPIIIFGPKNYGEINLKKLIKINTNERLSYLNKTDLEVFNISKQMKEVIKNAYFIDMQFISCQTKQNECRIFLENDVLISYDGSHLTKEGASYVGHKLKKIFIK
jgi:hypothetical protein